MNEMINKKIRVGVVGVGKLGQHHARIYAQMPDVELVGVADINEVQGQKIASKNNTTYYENIDEMIDKVDAINVATPTVSHHELAKKFLQAGVHCLVEKPITINLEQAEELVHVAREKNVVLQVGHIERFNPAILAAQQYLHHPRFIEVNRLGPYDGRVSDVGVVLDLMIHDLDIVLYLTNSNIVSVDAIGSKVFSPFEDIANVRLKFENGCVANISASRISLKTFRKIRVFQEDSYVSLDYKEQRLKIYRKKSEEISSLKDIQIIRPKFKKEEPLLLEISNFIDCVRENKKPVVDGHHGRNALELALEITSRL